MASKNEDVDLRMSHLEGVTDNARARELYKYFQPTGFITADTCFPDPSIASGPRADPKELGVTSDVSSSKISSPDTALTAFCQLVTWRTGAQRAMISVIDAETQYFVAESTRTVDLLDNTIHAAGDDIWMGCSSVSKAGRLCERTISTPPTPLGDYPSFIVNNLSSDERFNTLPFVTDSPFLRFYAGVPLITKKGIPIGSLFIVDDRIGTGLSREMVNFMGTMAVTIMKHLEMAREVEEHRRAVKMSRGLASFVEGRAELEEGEADVDDEEGTKIAGQFEPQEPNFISSLVKSSTTTSFTSISSLDRKEGEYSAALSEIEMQIQVESESTLPDRTATIKPNIEDTAQLQSIGNTSWSLSTSHGGNAGRSPSLREESSDATSMKFLFSRAANLIREAFEVNGGAVFYDAQTGFSSDLKHSEPPSPRQADNAADIGLVNDEDNRSPGERNPDFDGEHFTPWASRGLGEGRNSRAANDPNKTVEILGFSTSAASSLNGDRAPGKEVFVPLSEISLHVLFKRYPRGKLWTFDEDGSLSGPDEEMPSNPYKDQARRQKNIRKLRTKSQRNKTDAMYLSKHFPGVTQLLFVPLWDAGRSQWLSGCFAWSTEPTRVLSKRSELAFLSAFSNSVMAEWCRIDTEIADQKKGDFIGSISHELRSPLHGILASAEFLAEACSGWEGHLVETIDSCGRTLLDTINHILDYSKINHFEKDWRRNKRGGRRFSAVEGGPLALTNPDLPMLSLFQDVDISVICEEVVESVFAGHVFQNITAQNFDTVPSARDRMSDFSGHNTQDTKKFRISLDDVLGDVGKLDNTEVTVILDVDPQNYHFTTQPGALRRLIMNLLGNALKYTSHGYIQIKLGSVEMEDLYEGSTSGSGERVARCQVTLTVSDTGKGISADFLRSKLFMPFAQENSLSSGTGLGLSIVRKIVSLLEGDIVIDSEVGRGTQVKVTLPMLRELPKTGRSSASISISAKSSTSVPRAIEECIANLRLRANTGVLVSLSGFDTSTKDPIIIEMYRLLKTTTASFLTKWYGVQVVPLGTRSHIIISNEEPPAKISLLAKNAEEKWGKAPNTLVLCSHNTKFDRVTTTESVSYVAKPIGPVKLARALMQCLDGALLAMAPLGLEVGENSESQALSEVFEELSNGVCGKEVLDNTRMAADSENARKAIENPTPTDGGGEKGREYPFPTPVEKGDTGEADGRREEGERVGVLSSDSAISVPTVASSIKTGISKTPAWIGKQETKEENSRKEGNTNMPNLLVVDDNQINQRLLSTYLKKKGFTVVDQASNGLEAVNLVRRRIVAGSSGKAGGSEGAKVQQAGYDIIFMDITMPILDGFGATRQIRALERDRVAHNGKEGEGLGREVVGGKVEPALMIAFTGRSSMEDQNEAVRVGLDLFMTKPVSFKEVGKILDNWMSNREKEEMEVGRS